MKPTYEELEAIVNHILTKDGMETIVSHMKPGSWKLDFYILLASARMSGWVPCEENPEIVRELAYLSGRDGSIGRKIIDQIMTLEILIPLGEGRWGESQSAEEMMEHVVAQYAQQILEMEHEE